MKYVDGFVLVVPKKNLPAYKKMAIEGSKIWKKYGALEYMECVGDDLSPDMGGEKVATFPEITKLRKGELVIFSYIVFKSKKHRDEVNKKVMSDPEMDPEKYKDKAMPFDLKRMAYGGFEVLVDA